MTAIVERQVKSAPEVIELIEALPIKAGKIPLTIDAVSNMLLKGYLQADIARLHNVSDQAVSQFIQVNRDKMIAVLDYDDRVSTRLKLLNNDILEGITKKDIDKASLQQKVTSHAINTEKIRLLEDKSTVNVSFSALISQSVEDK